MANRERVYLSVPVSPRKRQEVRTAALDQNTSMIEWLTAAIDERLERQRHRVSAPPLRGKAPGNRKFSDDEEREIAQRYRTEKTVDLAREYGINEATVVNIAKRQGVSKRRPGRGVGGEMRDDITARYASGEAVKSIASAHKLSPEIIHEIAVANGAKDRRRSRNSTRGRLVRDDVTARYIMGEEVEQIAASHGISTEIVHEIAVSKGAKDRRNSRRKPSRNQEVTLSRRYQQGERTVDLAREYGITESTVLRIARRHGVRVQRSRKKMIEERPISLETAEEIGKLFAVGKSVNAIADMYNLDPSRVKDIVKTLGLGGSRKSKAPKRLRPSKVTTQQIKDWAAESGLPHLPRGRVPDWVVAQYQERPLDSETVSDIFRRSAAGESPQKIALDYKLTPERVALIVLEKEQTE